MNNIKIPYNHYFFGRKNLELELPWITPGSTYRLDELLNVVVPWKLVSKDRATKTENRHKGAQNRSRFNFKSVEFGSGGSTIFLARRCKHVLSFEHSKEWADKVINSSKKKNINNVRMVKYSKRQELENHINNIKDGRFNCALIDNKWKIMGRDEVLQKIIPKLNEKAIIVLDNYGSEASFRESYDLTIEEFIEKYLDSEWMGEEFNSTFWGGLGTRIFHRNIIKKVNVLIPSSNTIHAAKWFNV